MNCDDLCKLLFDGLKPTLESHRGAAALGRERTEFEGWLKIEACRVLEEHGLTVVPDDGKFDITFGDWALDIRTIPTNIPCAAAQTKKFKTTTAIEALIKDIWRLTSPGRAVAASKRGVLFAVYPAEHDNERWQSMHLSRISTEVVRLQHEPFAFAGGIPGLLYFALCAE